MGNPGHTRASNKTRRFKRLLLRHGYPLDQAAGATELVLKQAETIGEAA